MQKEAETLLKVLGTDAEIGTHAAVPEYLALVNSIKDGKNVYCAFPGVSFDRKKYRQAVMDLAPFLNQMSEPAFSRYLGFIQFMDFHLDTTVGKAIKDSSALPSWCDEQIDKRAQFLQTFGRLKPPLYTLKELEGETAVKEKYPWQWIDATRHNYPGHAHEEIVRQLTTNPDTRYLELRIPAMVHDSPPQFLDGIVEAVQDKLPKQILRDLKARIARSRSLKG